MRRQTASDSKPRWLRQMVEPFADTAGRPDPDPLLTMWLPAAPTSSRAHRCGHSGTPTQNARTTTRDTGHPHPDIGQPTRGHRLRGHWTVTPDTGHWTPDAWSDRVRGQGDLDTEGIPDRLPGRSRLPDCPLGRRTVDLWSAPSALGDGEVPASTRLPTALPGACSVAPSARPSRALAHCSPQRLRVERRASGDASSVMALDGEQPQLPSGGGACGGVGRVVDTRVRAMACGISG
jgi:hypothetical protein